MSNMLGRGRVVKINPEDLHDDPVRRRSGRRDAP